MAAAGFEWLGLNIADYFPGEWSTVRQRAALEGVVCLPKARLGVPEAGATKESCLAKLSALCLTADAWDTPYLIVNAEHELSQGIITPSEIADIVGERQAAISSEANLYWAVDWTPLIHLPVLLQVYPQDARLEPKTPERIAQWQAECVRGARERACFTYVGVTLQTYGGAQPEWYDLSTVYSVFTGDDIGYGNWSKWSPTP